MTKSLFSRTEFFLGIVVLLILLLCIKTITILQNISNLTENIPGSTSTIISEVNASSGTSEPKPNNNKSVASDNVITHESSDNIAIGKFNSDEVKLLKKLYERRKTIKKQEENLKNQENILKALSFNVTHKIQELKAIQKNIDDSIKKRDNEEKERMQNLVKIYESMNPKKAALVFNDLDTNILCGIINNMKNSKVGAILSNMNPIKARELSIALTKK